MNTGMFCLNIEVLVEGKIYWSFYPNQCDQMTMWGVIIFLDWHCIYYVGTTSQKTLVFVWKLTVLKWKCQEKMKAELQNFSCQMQEFFVVNSIRVLKWYIFYILEHSAFIGTCDYDSAVSSFLPVTWKHYVQSLCFGIV